MKPSAALLLALTLLAAACALATGPPGQPSITNVNPETGQRGGD